LIQIVQFFGASERLTKVYSLVCFEKIFNRLGVLGFNRKDQRTDFALGDRLLALSWTKLLRSVHRESDGAIKPVVFTLGYLLEQPDKLFCIVAVGQVMDLLN
jgi:hypothetical protein